MPRTFHRSTGMSFTPGGTTAANDLSGILVRGQVGIGERAPGGSVDRPAVAHLERAGIDAPPPRRHGREQVSRRGAALADRRDARGRRAAARGPAVIGHERRIGHDQADPVDVDAELLGGGLGQLGTGPLAALDLAGHDGDEAVLADVEACREGHGAPPGSAAATATAPGWDLRDRHVRGHRDQQARPQDLQELAPRTVASKIEVEVELDALDRLLKVIVAHARKPRQLGDPAVVVRHGFTPPFAPAARRTAWKIAG